jgi:hypothetical protein
LTGAGAGVVVLLESVVAFFAGFMVCFLLCFFTFGVVAGALADGVWLLAGGVAGVCAANVKGMVAKARAIVIKVVFIFVLSLAGS